MQTLSWKKITIGLVAVGIVALGIFYVTNSKGTKPPVTFINPAFAEFIASYTAGVIESGSSIRIVFTQDVVDSSKVGQETAVKLFSFSPSLKGKTEWLDRRTVEFTPRGKIYFRSAL